MAISDWPEVQKTLGAELPRDYMDLVDTYGPGSFDGFIWVLQPDGIENLNLLHQSKAILDMLRQLKASGERIPYRVEAEDNQLLPCAVTDNGDICYWRMKPKSHPNSWCIVVNDSRAPEWQAFDMTLSNFLLKALTGAISVPIFPDDFPSPSPLFIAQSD